MTKITKEAFYCALAIGILGTYNSMFEAKAAAAPEGAGPVAPAVPAVPEARDTGAKFGMVNGGYSYDEALKISRGELHIGDGIRESATSKIRDVNNAIDHIRTWSQDVFAGLTEGLEAEEVVFELLNWPVTADTAPEIAASVRANARTFLLTGNVEGDNSKDRFKNRDAHITEIQAGISIAAENIRKSKIMNLKANRNALEEVLDKLRDIDVRTSTLIRNYDEAMRNARTHRNEGVIAVFEAHTSALDACISGFAPIQETLNHIEFEDIFNNKFEELLRQAREAADRVGKNYQIPYRTFRIISNSHFFGSIAHEAIRERSNFIEQLSRMFNNLLFEFNVILANQQMEKNKIIEMSKDLARIAESLCKSSRNVKILKLFAVGGFFDTISNTVLDDRIKLKKEIYLKLQDLEAELRNKEPNEELKKTIRIVQQADWNKDKEQRMSVIPKPNDANDHWDSEKMLNLSDHGDYNNRAEWRPAR